MFDDLDASLAAVLADTGAPTEVRNADVSFAVPDKDFTPGQVTLNLFLHEVQENRALRDDTPQRQPLAGGGWVSRRAPLRVDCTYLITAWSPVTGGLKAAEEHRLLGRTLLWLARFPVVPDSFLRGTLKIPPQPFPPATSVAQTREGQSMGEFWTALGIAPRPAFSLTATIALQPFTETETLPGLKAVQLRGGLLGDPLLRGRVFDPTLAAVPGASVRLVEAARTVTSGPTGGFSFADVPFGTYTLTVRSAGHPDATTTVDYGQDAQVHDVMLTGP
ncbi:Pvc16 family protein [Streptomyces sp. NBC_00203]|uniref:Pvc16 family protein n=1 Tax=Streptomyces sp. NBC_00203 TaxID=2975680 RepID=UPI003243B4A8